MQNKKEYKIITVVIRVIDVKTEKVESTQTKIIDGPERREWLQEALGKTTMWAMLNGKYVEIINKEDDVDEDAKE